MDFLSDVWGWLTDSENWTGSDGIPALTKNHLQVSIAAMLTATVIALPIGLWLGHLRRGGVIAINVANVGRALPTYAILVFAVLWIGISSPTWLEWTGSAATWIALVLLAIPPILTNTYVGMVEVDADLVDAARGMGMKGPQIARRVELPMAVPLVMAGIRTATLAVIATATLAAFTGYDTLGTPINIGLRVNDSVRVFGGALLVSVLAISIDLFLALAQRTLTSPGLARSEYQRPAAGAIVAIAETP
jgi:osmoprotectant transport system permease protein